MSIRTMAVIALLMGLCCSGAFGAQTLNSASGYVQLPSARIAQEGAVDLAVAGVGSEGTNELFEAPILFPCHGRGLNVRALAGLGGRFELGVGYLGISKEIGDAHAFTAAAKYSLYENAARDAMISLGAAYRWWNSDMGFRLFGELDVSFDLPNVFSAYLVWDRVWPKENEDDWQATSSIGLIYDHYGCGHVDAGYEPYVPPDDKIVGQPIGPSGEIGSEDFIRPFLGVRVARAGWSFLAEYKPRLRSGDFYYAKDIWSAALSKCFGDAWSVTAGVTNSNMPYTDSDPGFFVDLSYRFGK